MGSLLHPSIGDTLILVLQTLKRVALPHADRSPGALLWSLQVTAGELPTADGLTDELSALRDDSSDA